MPFPEPGTTAHTDRLIGRMPPFSPIALRLMSIIFDEAASFKDVAALIRMDPVMSGEVLRLANSGFYGRRASVQSILHAIVLVGSERLTGIVITAALWEALPRQRSPFIKDWWRHNLASALVAEHISQKGPNMDSAYTAGLLHGVGQLALFQHSPPQYLSVMNMASSAGADQLEIEQQNYGCDHAELAAKILGRWHLPMAIQGAVATHHDEFESPASLAAAVKAGCFTAEYLGFGKCGCHTHIAVNKIPKIVTDLIESGAFVENLAQRLNGIECSLL